MENLYFRSVFRVILYPASTFYRTKITFYSDFVNRSVTENELHGTRQDIRKLYKNNLIATLTCFLADSSFSHGSLRNSQPRSPHMLSTYIYTAPNHDHTGIIDIIVRFTYPFLHIRSSSGIVSSFYVSSPGTPIQLSLSPFHCNFRTISFYGADSLCFRYKTL